MEKMTAFCRIVAKFAAELFKQDRMKKIFRTLCVLCVSLSAFTSCLKNDETESTVYSDAVITQFTMGQLNRYTSTTSSKTGNDTIIKSTLTGSNYPMTIDQLGCKIYNKKLLPVGTDIRHIPLTTVTAKNSGIVLIKSMTSDTLRAVSTTDSIDFSSPRIFRVFSSDGQSHRDYTVTVNVSKTAGSTFEWTKVRDDINTENFTDRHLVAVGDSVVLTDKDIITVNNAYGPERFMRISSNGYVESRNVNASEDAWSETYDDTASKPGIKRLIGATAHEIFGIGDDNTLKVSLDGIGLKWLGESLDDDASLLPIDNMACVNWPYAPADDTDFVLLAGNSQQDDQTVVIWRKISQYGGQTVWQNWGQWVYYPIDDKNIYTLPRQDNLSMTYYSNSILAIGDKMTIYESRDQGITWMTESTYALPDDIGASHASIATDSQGRLWIVTDKGELWRGEK